MCNPCHLAGLFAGQSAELFITCHLWFPGGGIGFSAVAPLAFPSVVIELEYSGICLFLPGHPSPCLTMIAISLGISVFQRMLNRESQFIYVPQLVLPLLCLVAVAVVTADLTGLGLRTFGNDVYGGKKYVYLLGAILGYFALSACRIPPERKNLFLALFFLGGISASIGDLLPLLPHSLYFIYWFFQPNEYFFTTGGLGEESTRFAGASATSIAVFSYMLARYGIRGIFLSGKPLRWLTFILMSIYGLFGGFRSMVLIFALIFALQFFLEGLHRTKLLLIFLFAGALMATALVPLASHLPHTFQRALSFLPLKVDPMDQMDAQNSLDWRVQMWKALLPQVPQYLFLGKGYAISPLDYEFMGPGASTHAVFAENQGLALAGDYHNGPLSVILPFGIWGAIAFVWFLFAAIRVLYANYRYGDPSLRVINTFLLAAFVARVIFFLLIVGALSNDMLAFCGLLGLSVSLNGGVCRPLRTMSFQAANQFPVIIGVKAG